MSLGDGRDHGAAITFLGWEGLPSYCGSSSVVWLIRHAPEGWGDGSVGKVPCKHEDLSVISRVLVRKQKFGRVVCACNLRAGEVEKGRYPRLSGQHSYASSRLVRDPASRKRGG